MRVTCVGFFNLISQNMFMALMGWVCSLALICTWHHVMVFCW